MASAFARFASSLSPAPQLSADQYQGTQYNWRFLTFRPAVLKLDALLLAAAVAYFVAYWLGKSANAKRANAWYNAHLPLLSAQFSKPTARGLTADGHSDFANFSTGRRAVSALHTVFRLIPRHDLLQLVYQFVWSSIDLKYRPEDRITLEFELDEKACAAFPDLVWAVVVKDELTHIRGERWDLTFAKTTENSALPPTLSVMSELADVTENILKPFGSLSLPKLLSDPINLRYFRSLSVTDQPYERPLKPLQPSERKKYVILSLSCPPPSQASATVPLVTGVFQLVDALSAATGKPLLSLRPETKTKLRKKREELDAELKADSEKDAKEAAKEALEAKEAAKRKAEQDRIASLPASEQAKILERERKRTLRKGQGKMVRK